MENKVTFGSKFGTLVVVAGSCVGLGNIWRFPYLAGNNGGSAFIIIYILCSLTIAIPIMMSEFVVGRSTRKNAFGAFKELSRQKKWCLVGLFRHSDVVLNLWVLFRCCRLGYFFYTNSIYRRFHW